jgi:hypothetical protein
LRQTVALRRQKLAPCPDSYWFRMDDYLTWARAMREEARRATGPARAQLIETAAQWEAIVCEHLDFLAELEDSRNARKDLAQSRKAAENSVRIRDLARGS